MFIKNPKENNPSTTHIQQLDLEWRSHMLLDYFTITMSSIIHGIDSPTNLLHSLFTCNTVSISNILLKTDEERISILIRSHCFWLFKYQYVKLFLKQIEKKIIYPYVPNELHLLLLAFTNHYFL